MIRCLPSAVSMPSTRIADRGVELVERVGLGLEFVLVERVEHVAPSTCDDRVVRGEVVAVEERVEDRPGDEVLGQHLDRVVAGDAVVEVAAQAGEEVVELLGATSGSGRRGARVMRVIVARRRCRRRPWPSPPSSARSPTFCDDPGVDRVAPARRGPAGERRAGRRCWSSAARRRGRRRRRR